MIRNIISAILVVVASMHIAHANVEVRDGYTWLVGEISAKDVDLMAAFLTDYRTTTMERAVADFKKMGVILSREEAFAKLWPTVYLDSRGGDVASAMQIGRLMRENRVRVIVLSGRSCLSSCPLALAGAPRRYVDAGARIGIHRLIVNDDRALTSASQKQNYATIEAAVKGYLNEMNIPTTLYDTMFRVPNEKLRILSPADLEAFGLSNDDPYLEEAKNAEQAQQFGITKAEYLRRKAISDKVCRGPDPSCWHRIMSEGK